MLSLGAAVLAIQVAALFPEEARDPELSSWTDEAEPEANRRYAAMIPDDSCLVARFNGVFRDRQEQFAPFGHA